MNTENKTVEIVNRKGVALTAEQKEARRLAKEANEVALVPYLDEAIVNCANRKGFSAEQLKSLLDMVQIKAMVKAEAQALKDKAEGKVVGAPRTGNVGETVANKFKAQLQRAFGYLKAHPKHAAKLDADALMEIINFAMANPIMQTREKKEVPAGDVVA